MTMPVADRLTADAATRLMGSHGPRASDEAALRAEASRDRGNALQFCHWRQVARLIDVLSDDAVVATLH
jgi:hypothetical protein